MPIESRRAKFLRQRRKAILQNPRPLTERLAQLFQRVRHYYIIALHFIRYFPFRFQSLDFCVVLSKCPFTICRFILVFFVCDLIFIQCSRIGCAIFDILFFCLSDLLNACKKLEHFRPSSNNAMHFFSVLPFLVSIGICADFKEFFNFFFEKIIWTLVRFALVRFVCAVSQSASLFLPILCMCPLNAE